MTENGIDKINRELLGQNKLLQDENRELRYICQLLGVNPATLDALLEAFRYVSSLKPEAEE